MTGVITLTAAMRANLQSLQGTQSLLDQTQLRLSTGNKVNSALDNPVNFFAAQSLNNRAGDLSSLLDGMGQGIQVLKTTDQAITSLTSYVTQLKSLANSAKSALNQTTTVKTIETAGGSGLDSTSVAGLDNANAANAITANDSFSLQNGSGPVVTYTITAGETLQQLVDAINATSGLSASIVYGDGTTKSSSSVDAAGAPSGATLATGSAYLKIVSLTGDDITAANVVGTSALTGLGIGNSVAVKSGGSAATQIASYADTLSQIDQTVVDANYQGTNLINGINKDLTVQVNEKSQKPVVVKSIDLSSVTGLGLDANANTWTSATNIDASIAKIDAALATLRAKSGAFANSLSIIQTRQDFTTNLVNTLKDGASKLTIADKNEEGANLLALQTSQQLGIQALSLSSQANQSVLRLFA